MSWQDLPGYYRLRQQALCLDSVKAVTRGSDLGMWDFLAHLNPVRGTYIAVYSDSEATTLLGQISCPLGARVARLSYVMPGLTADSGAMCELIDYLAAQAGEWGALYLTAEVDENSSAFESLRRAGFTIYTRQRIWQLSENNEPQNTSPKHLWQTMTSMDEVPVRNLLQSIVPPLVQPLDLRQHSPRLNGLVFREAGELLAYTEVVYGPCGLWVQPFIHPAAEDVSGLLLAIPLDLPPWAKRPINLGVCSYQAWLEPLLENLNAGVGPRQALMVRRLAIEQKANARVHLPALESQRAEPSAPFVRPYKSDSNYDTTPNNR